MIFWEAAHGICLSKARARGRKRRRRRRRVGSRLRGSSSSQSCAPWLFSTSSWRLNLSSASSHQGEGRGLGKGSSTITDQNKNWGTRICIISREAQTLLMSARLHNKIPQKCGHHSPCAQKHPLHNRHTAMSASSSLIFISLINTQVGKHSILHETPVTWRVERGREGEEMGHMVTDGEEAKRKRGRVRSKAFFSLPVNFCLNLKSVGLGEVLYCSGSWYPPVAFPYEARLGQYESSVSSRNGTAWAQAGNYRPFYPANPPAITALKHSCIFSANVWLLTITAKL